MDKYPRSREILIGLGVLGFLAASLLMPGLPKVLTPFLKKQYKKWGHFNKRRLKAELKRMQKIGLIEQGDIDGEIIFKLTNKGKNKLFKYNLENLKLKRKYWDKKWRVVAYDIPKGKKNQADAFRLLLKKMEFYQLQKSILITPYKCENEINFLKNIYNLNDNVTLLTIANLENELAYKKYFGL